MSNHMPNLPGAVNLEMPQPQTHHTTYFQGCNLSLTAVVDEDKIVRGYQLQILDVRENHTYIFGLNRTQEKDKVKEAFEQIPDIGFPLEAPA